MRLLLISNSTNPGEEYLDYPKNNIKEFLGEKPVKALFIPYAGVTVSFDDYEAKVKHRFNEVGHDIISIHHFEDPIKAVEEAEAIVDSDKFFEIDLEVTEEYTDNIEVWEE